MNDTDNILLYAAALYQVKEPKVYSTEAKILMATMHQHLVRLINLIESSTKNLPPYGMSNFYNIDSLPGAICEAELQDHEAHSNVSISRINQGQTRWESKCNAPRTQTTHQTKSSKDTSTGRLF